MTATAALTHITIYWDRESCPPPNTSHPTDSVSVIRELLIKVCVTERRLRLKHLVSWSLPDRSGVDIYNNDNKHNWDQLLVSDNYDKYVFFNSYLTKALSDRKTELVVITGDQTLLQIIKALELDISGQLSIIYDDLLDIRELGFSCGIKRLSFENLVYFCTEYEKYCLSAITGLNDFMANLNINENNLTNTSQIQINMTETNSSEKNRNTFNNWWNRIKWLVCIIAHWFYSCVCWNSNKKSLRDYSQQQQHQELQPTPEPESRSQSYTKQDMSNTRKRVINKSNEKQDAIDGQLSGNLMPQCCPSTSAAAAVASSDDKEFSDDSSSDDDDDDDDYRNPKKVCVERKSVATLRPSGQSLRPISPTPGSSGQSSRSSGCLSSDSNAPKRQLYSEIFNDAINPKKISNNSGNVEITDKSDMKNTKTTTNTEQTNDKKPQQKKKKNNKKKNKKKNNNNNRIDKSLVSIDKSSDNTSVYNQYLKSKKTYESGICGLGNLGNTCYMNSALQCLSNIPSMVEFCRNFKNCEIISTPKSLLKLFSELIERMWSQQTDCFSPNEFRAKVAKVLPTFAGCGQQDCSEFLRSLLDTFHEELLRMSGIDNNSSTDYKTFDEYLHNNQTFISDNFHGLQLLTFSCSRCGHRLNEVYNPFVVMNLPQLNDQDLTFLDVSLVINSTGSDTFRCDTYVLRLPVPRNKILVSQLIKTLTKSYSDTTSLVLNVNNLIVVNIIDHIVDKIYDTNDIINVNCLSGDLFVYQFDPSFVNHLFVSLQSDSQLFGIPLLLDINEYTGECVVNAFIVQFMKCLAPEGQRLLGMCPKHKFKFMNIRAGSFDPNRTIGNNIIINKLSELICQYYNIIDETYHGLDEINFDKNIKLEDCINSYLAVQRMDDQQNCPNCNIDVNPTEQNQVLHAPNVLLLQVRTSISQQRGSYYRYNSQPDCQFPMELDFTSHVVGYNKANGPQHVYDLLAISNYTGSSYSGHYTAYAKNHINKKWYEFNDNYVNQISNERQLQSKAYILVYFKRNINTIIQ
ncbi:uncharacterized protein LOC128951309 [Oppia nitens]|uniref:uncharacterized protein LOC128951309 n=1 Tax=Oppia nitens TaxID=1686743 RepID=UPI0023DC4C52|nr:uncharacterized protein LOC128951309 [Oppia nitens]